MNRANAEFLIIAMTGPLLTQAGMDGTTVDGTNTDCNGPIGKAVRGLDHLVADPVLVTDADVALVTVAETDEFLDGCVLAVLEAVLGNLDDADITVGPRSEKLSQLAAQIERKLKRLQDAMEDLYGYGMAVPEVGVITIDIAEHD